MSMIVGVCTIELRLHDAHSLKSKRQVLKSITSRVKNKFNVAIAEVDDQDVWQRAVLGVAVVSTGRNGTRLAPSSTSKTCLTISLRLVNT